MRTLYNGKMKAEEREFQVFVKPAGAECNLRCSYCYYLIKKDLYRGDQTPFMKKNTLEKYIIQHFKASTETTVSFSWHGGEPLLAGIDFYKEAVRLQKKHKPSGTVVINGIQTNATLLNDDWCRFFASEKFIAGISIDGPEEFHGRHRTTASGLNSFNSVINGFKLLKKHGVIPEILCVVSSGNVAYPLIVYNFFKSLGAEFITFLPLVERMDGMPGGVSDKTVPSEEFGVFLGKIFDEWVEKDIGKIKIQIFEEALRSAFNQDHTLCIFKKDCGGVPVLEHNGDLYSCDHFVNKDNLLGNIDERSLSEMLDSEKQIHFGKAKSKTLPQYCLSCGVRQICNGECPKNRFISTPDGDPGLNYLCEGYKYFFNHCQPFIEAVRTVWKKK